MIVDTFIPTVWFNSVFSYLKNFEISLSPIEEWFKWTKFFFIKRPWFWTKKNTQDQYVWELEWNYIWHYVYQDTWYVRDDLWKVYKFYKDTTNNYVLEKIYDNTDWLEIYEKDTYWNYVQQRALTVNYLTEKLWSYTVQSANNFAWSWDVVELVVNEAWSFTSADIWKYLYFPYQASADWRFMFRQIVEVVDDRTVHLNEQLYTDPATINISWQPIEKYDRLDEVIVFNNLKEPTTRQVLTYEITTWNFELRMLWWKDIAIYDWRYWNVTEDGSSVWWSVLTWEYEILDPDTAFWNVIEKRGERILSIYPYRNYLLIFYKTTIAVIRQIWKDSNWIPIYNWNTILWETWIFSPESYFIKEWNLYVFTIWKKICSLEIKPQSTNIIEWVLQSQADIIQHKLNDINYTQRVKMFWYDVWIWLLVSDEYWTYIWKYTFEYKWRYYNESKKTLKSYYSWIYWDWMNWCERWVVLKWWETDLWEDIEQEVQIVWPQQTYWDAFTILQLKILLWYYDNVMDFEVELDLWHEKFITNIYDTSQWINFVQRQNIATWDWSLSTVPMSYNLYWWVNTLKNKINKIWLMSLRVWKSWVYYKFTLRNRNNKNINFWYLWVQYKQGNPLVAPIMNVT